MCKDYNKIMESINAFGKDQFTKIFLNDLANDIQNAYDFCKLSTNDMDILKEMIKKLDIEEENTKEKGDKLENIISFIFEKLDIFRVVCRNIRNSTNEIDLIIELTERGKFLLDTDLFPFKETTIFLECKNYNQTVRVTWVQKFANLLKTCNHSVGILVSIKGLAGKGWGSSKGIVRKASLADNLYIIDINLEHLNRIANGENLLKILKDEKRKIDIGVDYSIDGFNHPAEDDFKNFKNI